MATFDSLQTGSQAYTGNGRTIRDFHSSHIPAVTLTTSTAPAAIRSSRSQPISGCLGAIQTGETSLAQSPTKRYHMFVENEMVWTYKY